MRKQKPLINYDSQSDVLYISIKKGMEEEFVEISPGVNVEIDERGEVIGIEFLNVSKVFQPIAKSLVQKLALVK